MTPGANPDDLEERLGLALPGPEKYLYRRFETYAALQPDAIACVCGTQSISYAELNRRANLLANELIELGTGPDVLVGLCMQPSVEQIAGILAVMKSGGAYVALDPAYPAERLTGILEQAQRLLPRCRARRAGPVLRPTVASLP